MEARSYSASGRPRKEVSWRQDYDDTQYGDVGAGAYSGAGGIFKGAAIEVLKQEKRLMSTGDITKLALERKMVRCTGKTPENTMASAMYTDVRKKGGGSPFIKPKEGLFGLKVWLNEPWLLDWLAKEGISIADFLPEPHNAGDYSPPTKRARGRGYAPYGRGRGSGGSEDEGMEGGENETDSDGQKSNLALLLEAADEIDRKPTPVKAPRGGARRKATTAAAAAGPRQDASADYQGGYMRPPPPQFLGGPGALAGAHKMPPMHPFMPFGPNPYLMGPMLASAAGHFNPMMAPGLDAARMAAFGMMPGMAGAMPGAMSGAMSGAMPGMMPGFPGMPPASMMPGAPAGGAAAEAVPGIGPVTKGLRGRRGGVEPEHAHANGKENSANGHAAGAASGGAAAGKDAKNASDGAEAQARGSDVAAAGGHKDQDADVPAAAANTAGAEEPAQEQQQPEAATELQRQHSAPLPQPRQQAQQQQEPPGPASAEQARPGVQARPVPAPLVANAFRPVLSAAQLAAATAQYKQSVDAMAGGGGGAGDVVDSRRINLYRQHLMFLERTLGNMHPQVGKAYIFLARVLQHEGSRWSLTMAQRALLRAWQILASMKTKLDPNAPETLEHFSYLMGHVQESQGIVPMPVPGGADWAASGGGMGGMGMPGMGVMPGIMPGAMGMHPAAAQKMALQMGMSH